MISLLVRKTHKSSNPVLEVIFVTLTENSSVVTNDTSEISTSPEIAVVTNFHARHGTTTTPVFLPADGDTF